MQADNWDRIFVSFQDTMKYAEEKYKNYDENMDMIPIVKTTITHIR